MPPVRWACGLAASTEDTFVESIQKFPIFERLGILNIDVLFWCLSLKEWLNCLVLGIEMAHVNNQVFENKHVHER